MTRAVWMLVVVLVVGGALAGCIPESTGDFALCCTCLNQKSPVNDGNAVDPTTNCLPDATADSPGEVDQCNQQAADEIADIGNAAQHPIQVVDELCTAQTCQAECNGAKLRGAQFEVVQPNLGGQ